MRRLLAMLCLGALLLGGLHLAAGHHHLLQLGGGKAAQRGDGITYLTHSSNVVLVKRPK